MCKDDGAKPATATNTTDKAPWSGAVPYINQGLEQSKNLYNAGGPAYYPGQTYAGTNDAMKEGLSSLANINSTYDPLRQAAGGAVTGAIGAGQNVGSNANSIMAGRATDNPGYSFFSGMTRGDRSQPGIDTLTKYANGDMLSAENPYFKQMSDSIRAQVLPSINGQFSQAGRAYSGLAGRAQGEGLGDAIGKLAYDNYQTGMGYQRQAASDLAGYGERGATGMSNMYNQNITDRLNAGNQGISAGNLGLNAAQIAPSIQNMGINAGNAALLAGTTQQGLEQGVWDDAQKRWNYNQNLPYENLRNYIANITGQTTGTGSSTSSGVESPAQASYWNQALGTGLAAASFFV